MIELEASSSFVLIVRRFCNLCSDRAEKLVILNDTRYGILMFSTKKHYVQSTVPVQYL